MGRGEEEGDREIEIENVYLKKKRLEERRNYVEGQRDRVGIGIKELEDNGEEIQWYRRDFQSQKKGLLKVGVKLRSDLEVGCYLEG